MLPTFVIGLREGLEAALIVGIIAAFLRKQGRRDLLRWVLLGVTTAVVLCVGVGVALDQLSRDLPQKQQEGLETIIGVLAVGMVTYMVIWMRRHSRELKGQLEGLASDAMDTGGSRAARAMVLMAFLAVLREGFETVVFLLAAFNETGSGAGAGAGAVIGIAVAVLLGYGIYRGGVRLNLSKFFRATGLVLVLVAAGLVVNALHTAHEAGWLNSGQGATVDLTWLVRPGSVQSSLLTGMLGVQTHPVVIEVVGWLVYLIPVGLYVAWPPGRVIPRRSLLLSLSGVAAVGAVAALVFALAAPARPDRNPTTSGGGLSVQLIGARGDSATARTEPLSPAASPRGGVAVTDIPLRRTDEQTRAGQHTDVYTAGLPGRAAADRSTAVTPAQLATLNGGRLPIGVRPTAAGTIAVHYNDLSLLTVWVVPSTGRIVDASWTETVYASAVGTAVGTVPLATPVATGTAALPTASVSAAGAAAARDARNLDRRSDLVAAAWACGVLALLAALAAVGFLLSYRRREPVRVTAAIPDARLVRS